MTTVPGFNHLIQQSGSVNESHHSPGTANPDPGHGAAEQIANEQTVKTTVQKSGETERIKPDLKREKKENKNREKQKKKKDESSELSRDGNDPDSTGRLLDTIV